MSNRRRANNRGRSRANKTNLDDLDGALSGMISRPDNNKNNHHNVKLVVDPSEERRFTMHSSNTETTRSGSFFADSLKGVTDPIDISAGHATHTPDFEKHQVNYSDTKYIKP